jgi:homospermidine synthase
MLLIVGCGSVGHAILETLPLCRLIPPKIFANVVIIEPRELNKDVVSRFPGKIEHIKTALTPTTLNRVMNSILDKFKPVACIDVSVDVDALAILRCCVAKKCLYINTSMELWQVENANRLDRNPRAIELRTLYHHLWEAKKEFAKSKSSVVVDNGMNPGLVSHFVMCGLYKAGDATTKKLIVQGKFSEAARREGLRVIHVSERDTQQPKKKLDYKKTFYNTWSVLGFVAEARDPVQIGHGTHEKSIPGEIIPRDGPRNMIFLPKRGMDVRLRSFVPGGPIEGYAIPHGEANTLSLTLTSKNDYGVYRPSVYYVYQCSEIAQKSLEWMRKNDYHMQPNWHVLSLPEIKSGYDAVGALLCFADGRTYWSGTILSVPQVKKLGYKFSGPTTVQVAISIISTLRWLLKNKSLGFMTPESVPWKEILSTCKKFLGSIVCKEVKANLQSADLSLSSFMTQ